MELTDGLTEKDHLWPSLSQVEGFSVSSWMRAPHSRNPRLQDGASTPDRISTSWRVSCASWSQRGPHPDSTTSSLFKSSTRSAEHTTAIAGIDTQHPHQERQFWQIWNICLIFSEKFPVSCQISPTGTKLPNKGTREH